jgi:hypothetical protein
MGAQVVKFILIVVGELACSFAMLFGLISLVPTEHGS